ncbi:hypothetical protein Pelo_18686 [Pelomyxa schiedti]|nr:hypothetical protein Pelo_18686 [Pelomyxa schiedti]
MSEVCRGGHLETAKWVVSRFGLRESWELAAPFAAAVCAGKLEVAQWLCGSFGVGWAMNTLGWKYPSGFRFKGDLDTLKWLLEVFPDTWKWGGKMKPMGLASGVMNNKKIPLKSRVEALNWLKSQFPFDQQAIQHLTNKIWEPEALKWMMETHAVKPKNERTGSWFLHSYWWREVEGVNSVEWLVDNFPMALRPSTFFDACKNVSDDVHCVKVLSQVVTLTSSSTEKAILAALAHGNVRIANWLEATFHVMERNVSTDSKKANSMFDNLCVLSPNYGDTRAAEWFFQHVPATLIKESTVVRALSWAQSSLLLLLLRLFNVPSVVPPDDKPWINIIRSALSTCWNPVLTHIASNGLVTPVCVANHISEESYEYISSKVLKRLVHEFHITEDVVDVSTKCSILGRLMSSGKTSCAEWFIKHFHVTFEEMLQEIKLRDISFPMWKMLLSVFPQVTANIVVEKMRRAVRSPVHIEFAMRNLGLTTEQVTKWIEEDPVFSDTETATETKLWAHKFTRVHPSTSKKTT